MAAISLFENHLLLPSAIPPLKFISQMRLTFELRYINKLLINITFYVLLQAVNNSHVTEKLLS